VNTRRPGHHCTALHRQIIIIKHRTKCQDEQPIIRFLGSITNSWTWFNLVFSIGHYVYHAAIGRQTRCQELKLEHGKIWSILCMQTKNWHNIPRPWYSNEFHTIITDKIHHCTNWEILAYSLFSIHINKIRKTNYIVFKFNIRTARVQ
jgi:hypothetical protein